MRTEKITIIVGHNFKRILANLERGALALNEMRPLREPNYSNLRTTIRDPRRQGDRVMAMLIEHCEELGISENSFNMVYEGFWD